MTVGTYSNTLPLTMVKLGEMVKLVQIVAGQKIVRRLIELGLTTGIEVQIIQDQGGPLILGVRDSRIVLGRGMAHKILVRPSENSAQSTANTCSTRPKISCCKC